VDIEKIEDAIKMKQFLNQTNFGGNIVLYVTYVSEKISMDDFLGSPTLNSPVGGNSPISSPLQSPTMKKSSSLNGSMDSS